MNKLLTILFILFIFGLGTGIFVLKGLEDEILGNRIIGFSVVGGVFILMPLFLYKRLKGKKLKDYTLTKDNIDRWRDELNE